MNDFPFSPFVHFTASAALIYIQPEVFHLSRAGKLKLFADISRFVVSCLNCLCFHPQVENLFKKKKSCFFPGPQHHSKPADVPQLRV